MWAAIQCIAIILIMAVISLFPCCDVSHIVRGGMGRAETVVFGDSAVGAFALIKDPRLKVVKISGATARGLGKPDGPTRLRIIEYVKEYQPKRVIFLFGMADCYVSCMYKAARGETSDYESIATDYVRFVESLDVEQKTIICPPYSPVEDEHVIDSTAKYVEVSEEDKKRMTPLISRAKRNAIVDTFNNTIKRMHPDVVDMNDFTSVNGKMKKQFMVRSPVNFHARWDALLPHFEKICGYKAGKNVARNITRAFKYLKEGKKSPPWSISSFEEM